MPPMKIDYQQFGERMMLARRRRKLTQFDIAQRVGVSSSHISDIERGAAKPAHHVIVEICTILDIAEPDALTVEAGEV